MTNDALRRWRRKHGLTQLALSQQLGVTATSVARWEQGVHKIPTAVELLLKNGTIEKRKNGAA